MKQLYRQIVAVLGSKIFATAVIGLAAFQSVWLAISSRYPMAFDEAYHYNLIKLHGQTLSPIIYQQPDGPAPYGALARDPSQTYHFILSIPYRFLEALGASEFVTVVTLRMFSVAMFCWGLVLFRKLLLKTKASRAAVHASMLFFVLIPTVPLLGGQLNYDNLQFLLLALALLVTTDIASALRSGKVPTVKVLQLATLCLLGTLTKFTFLPFMLAIILYLSWVAFRKSGKVRLDWKKVSTGQRRLWVGIAAVLAGLFVWFYGVNLAVYRNPVVQCHQVISPQRCQQFEPWQRNYSLAQNNLDSTHNPIKFTVDWVGGMFYRSFFVINGATGPKRYTNMVPIPISVAAIALSICGLPLVIRFGRRIVKDDPVLLLMLFTSALYLVALWGRNYNDFINLGQMVAINGRYFQPVLLPIILLWIAAYQRAFRLMPEVKLVILLASLALFSVGGGITGFVHYSDPDWYFEGRQFINQINQFARKLVSPLFLWRT